MTLASLAQLTGIIESLATIAAIVVGGIWTYFLFVRQRLTYPKAAVSHKVDCSLDSDILHVRVDVAIRNVGTTVVCLEGIDIWIQLVQPFPDHILTALADGTPVVRENEMDVDWPIIAKQDHKWARGSYEVEPGEEQVLNFDFMIPGGPEMIQVYSYIGNSAKPRAAIGWRTSSLHRIEAHSRPQPEPDRRQTPPRRPPPSNPTPTPQAPPRNPPPPPPKPRDS